MGHVIPLECLQSGETGEVVDISGNEKLVARLAESGLRTGTKLEALCPGNPLLVRVDNTRLSLRADGQVAVLVRVGAVAGW